MPTQADPPRRVLARVLAEDLNNEILGPASIIKSIGCHNPDICDEFVDDSWKLKDDQV